MILRHIIEKNYEYDKAGHLVRETVTTTEEQDDNYYGGWWQYPDILRLAPEDTLYLEEEIKIGD